MSKLLAVMFIYLSLCASFHFVEASSETWSETLSKTVARSAVTYVGSMICGPLCGVGGKLTSCYRPILRFPRRRIAFTIIQ